ncbi:dicarboxylate/amino acid:cation symporter [Roseibium algicola]|uniref:Dicarboxylate/amino acid:cation symporter n=1 Tax=Roseibium algicola TaxID=2857014 RepID=A0ABM6I4R2_9HYPH|nr:dicarboxylate/amino acid:cation symporter [Roseibium aggregatum]AQQ05334.1 dicarboxylate/amino acid:cation symporter [Roseibium aggregatum]
MEIQKRGMLGFWFRAMLWKQIAMALVVGSATGIALNMTGHIEIATSIKYAGSFFISAIKMLVVPIVFVSLVCGMTSISDVGRMGFIGLKAMTFYIATTAIAISIGLFLGIVFEPGASINLVADQTVEVREAPPFLEVLLGVIPTNPIAAAADGNILQIIFFAIIFGLAVTLAGPVARPIREFFEALNAVILKLAEVVISFAPYGVFALMTWVTGTYGLDLLLPLGTLIVAVYLGCFLHGLIVYGGLVSFVAKLSPVRFFQGVFEPMIVAFTSTSSSGTLPVTISAVDKNLGVSRSVSSFTLPLGATINMDGTALYQGVTALFIAQAYGVELNVTDYLTIVLTATLASIGSAGVPGGGLVMLSLVLTSVGLPLEGVAIIAGVDRILDMARTALNVTGDCACTLLVAKSEGEVDLSAYDTPHVLKAASVRTN